MATLAEFTAMRDAIVSWRRADDKRPVLVRLAPGGLLELRNDVPATRADCPKRRPCGHVRCEWHLWFQHGDERPGRRWAGKSPPPTLRPAWLENPLPPSCGADLVDAAEEDREDIRVATAAQALGIHRSRFREILQTAKHKLKLKSEVVHLAHEKAVIRRPARGL